MQINGDRGWTRPGSRIFRRRQLPPGLAVAAALVSSAADLPLAPELAIFGEIGLLGEVRAVSRAAERAHSVLVVLDAKAARLDMLLSMAVLASFVLGWIVSRVSGMEVTEFLSERIWSRMGAEQDAYMTVDGKGTPFAGGGLSASAVTS